MLRDYSFFVTDKDCGRIRGGTLIMEAEMYDAQKGRPLDNPNIQIPGVSVATAGSTPSAEVRALFPTVWLHGLRESFWYCGNQCGRV